jgi:hypothetical protein
MNRIEINVLTGEQAIVTLTAAEVEALQAQAPPAPAPDYQKFYDALLTSRAYQVIRAQAVTSSPLALTAMEFNSAMGDAKAGRPNRVFLQACLANIAATATDLDATDWAEIGELLVAHGLDGLYQLPDAGGEGSGSEA